MQAIITKCAKHFEKAAEDAHGWIETAAAALGKSEDENERLRAALTFAISHCTGAYFLTDKSDAAGELLGIDPLAIFTSRYEEAL